MENKNSVFIATSLDGMIADKNNGIDWLNIVPNPDNNDCGYKKFMEKIDAIVMGRSTYEIVLSFGVEWPYTVPVFLLSSTIKEVPKEYIGKVNIVSGDIKEVVEDINRQGYKNLYIDGGKTIQSFLKEDLIDEMIITRIPIVLGGGIPLFGETPKELLFKLIKSEIFIKEVIQSTYIRKR